MHYFSYHFFSSNHSVVLVKRKSVCLLLIVRIVFVFIRIFAARHKAGTHS